MEYMNETVEWHHFTFSEEEFAARIGLPSGYRVVAVTGPSYQGPGKFEVKVTTRFYGVEYYDPEPEDGKAEPEHEVEATA